MSCVTVPGPPSPLPVRLGEMSGLLLSEITDLGVRFTLSLKSHASQDAYAAFESLCGDIVVSRPVIMATEASGREWCSLKKGDCLCQITVVVVGSASVMEQCRPRERVGRGQSTEGSGMVGRGQHICDYKDILAVLESVGRPYREEASRPRHRGYNFRLASLFYF